MQKYLIFTIFLVIISQMLQTQESKKTIYFIRHAESKYNIVQAQIKNKYGQDYMKELDYHTAKFSKEYLDVDITEKGIQQCLQCKEKMSKIHVDLVIVSPLRRALKTCDIIFADHPSNPPVIVDPTFREVLCSSNDIGSRIEQSRKEFTRYDFSLITDPDYWYLLNIQDEQIKEKLLTKFKEAQHQSKIQAAIQITLEFLQEHFKVRQADPLNEALVRKVLPSLKRQRQILLQKLQKYNSIAVVSHSQNIKAYVGYKINNCEIYPFSEERLQNLQIKE